MQELKRIMSDSKESESKVPYSKRTLKLCREVEIGDLGSSHETLFVLSQWINYIDTKSERLISKMYSLLMCIEDESYATRWQQLRLWWMMRRFINLQERWEKMRLANIHLIRRSFKKEDVDGDSSVTGGTGQFL